MRRVRDRPTDPPWGVRDGGRRLGKSAKRRSVHTSSPIDFSHSTAFRTFTESPTKGPRFAFRRGEVLRVDSGGLPGGGNALVRWLLDDWIISVKLATP